MCNNAKVGNSPLKNNTSPVVFGGVPYHLRVKKMKEREKVTIQRQLEQYVAKVGSQAKASKQLGISGATVNAILNGKWESISEEMLRKVEAKTSTTRAWQIVETKAFQEITEVLERCQLDSSVTWVVGEAGCGKTTTARHYSGNNSNAIYVLCSEDMHRRDFLHTIGKALGFNLPKQNLRESLLDCVDKLLGLDRPLLIFDEADKLSDSVFHYFIQLYNLLEDRCGMTFLSTGYIEKRMQRGLALERRGYAEMHSRLGRRFYALDPTNSVDVYGICHANGVVDQNTIDSIIKDSEQYSFDLRRVKKLVQTNR